AGPERGARGADARRHVELVRVRRHQRVSDRRKGTLGSRQSRSILITGASSGIGRALAASYAAPGVRLALVGRNTERLAQAAAECEARGATVTCGRLDVRERAALATWIRTIDDEFPLDLAIASAGMPGGRSFGRLLEDADSARA